MLSALVLCNLLTTNQLLMVNTTNNRLRNLINICIPILGLCFHAHRLVPFGNKGPDIF